MIIVTWLMTPNGRLHAFRGDGSRSRCGRAVRPDVIATAVTGKPPCAACQALESGEGTSNPDPMTGARR